MEGGGLCLQNKADKVRKGGGGVKNVYVSFWSEVLDE